MECINLALIVELGQSLLVDSNSGEIYASTNDSINAIINFLNSNDISYTLALEV